MRLFLRWADKLHATCSVPFVVSPEVVGVQKQEDAPAGLTADNLLLYLGRGFREKQACTGTPGRSNYYPPLALGRNGCVLNKLEAEPAEKEFKRLVVVAYDQRYKSKGLTHAVEKECSARKF